EDRKFNELVESRNQGDALIHSLEKSMKDLDDKISDDEKQPVEAAIKELREALEGDDKAAIDDKTQKLSEAAAPIMEKVYGQQAGDEAESGQAADEAAGDASSADGDDVVDGDFEEVSDDDKQSGTGS